MNKYVHLLGAISGKTVTYRLQWLPKHNDTWFRALWRQRLNKLRRRLFDRSWSEEIEESLAKRENKQAIQLRFIGYVT